MPLGYGYVERDATSYVDWGAIGKNLSDMLLTEKKTREDKKAAIDKESRDIMKTLSEAPQGDHTGINEMALKFGDDGQKYMLTLNRLLKSGNLDLREYTVSKQNLLDGTTQAFNLMKEYQDEYKTKMEAYKNGELQSLTLDLMKDVEGFSNFSESSLYINPKDGTVSAGKMVKNPKTGVTEMSKNPNDFATINSLRNRIKATYKKYDAVGNVKGFVDGLGVELQSIANMGSLYKTGTIVSTLDVMKKSNLPTYKKFEQAETEAIRARLATQYDYTSVLTENIKSAPNGKIYDYTWDENEAKNNKNLILKKIDPRSGQVTVQLTAEQENAVIEYMRTEARLMYDKKVEIRETSQLSRNEGRPAEKPTTEENNAVNFGTNLAYLTTGTPSQQQLAVDYFKAIPGIASVERTGTGVNITTDDGDKLSYTFGSSSPKDFAGSIVKALNKEGLDENIILRNARKNLGGSITSGSATGTKTSTPTATKDQNYYTKQFAGITKSITSNKNFPSGIFHQEQDVVAQELNSILAPLGISVKPSGTFADYVTISAPGKKSIEIGADALRKSKAQEFESKLMGWLSENFPNESVLKSAFEAAGGGGVGSKY